MTELLVPILALVATVDVADGTMGIGGVIASALIFLMLAGRLQSKNKE